MFLIRGDRSPRLLLLLFVLLVAIMKGSVEKARRRFGWVGARCLRMVSLGRICIQTDARFLCMQDFTEMKMLLQTLVLCCEELSRSLIVSVSTSTS